jgi:hypothetical protein
MLFLRLSAVHSFVTKAPVVLGSYPFTSNLNANGRNHHLLKHVPVFGRLRMVDGAVVEVVNATYYAPGAAKTSQSGTVVLADDDEFIKPDLDVRQYRIIKLKNNLQALIVSTSKTAGEDDDSSQVEAASMHIQAGHFDDSLAGLAHFYEHMLVSGIERDGGTWL